MTIRRRGERRAVRYRRAVATATFVGLMVTALPGQLAAQEVGEDPGSGDDGSRESASEPPSEVGEQPGQAPSEEPEDRAPEMRLLTERLPVVDQAAGDGNPGMVVWPEGRRGYQLLEVRPEGDESANLGHIALAAIDLDTLTEVDRAWITDLDRQIYLDPSNGELAGYVPVDSASGRLFVPYRLPGATDTGADAGPRCAAVGPPCLAGILVVDGTTLQVVDDFEVRPITVNGAAVQPALRAMTYDADDDGGAGKLHLLVESQHVPGYSDADAKNRANVAVAIQLDAGTGAQDWATRVEVCNGFNRSADAGRLGRRHTIFRATGGEDAPRLYVGCLRSGGVVGVAKIELDGNDRNHPPVTQRSFIGPVKSSGFLFDPGSERLLAQVSPGSGTSIAVFDGQREAFIGAVGIGPNAIATGVDPESGRLYVLAPRKGEEPGGLLVGSVRGKLGQAVPVPQFEDVLTTYEGEDHTRHSTPIAVDPAADGRPRRVFLRPGGGSGNLATATPFYYVLEDPDEVTVDDETLSDAIAPPSDDVPLVDGATTVGFTGASRGYGFRALLLGGLEGIVSAEPSRGLTSNAKVDDRNFELLEGLLHSPTLGPLTALRIIDGLTPDGVPSLEEAYLGATHLPRPGSIAGASCLTRDRELVFGAVADDTEALLETDGASATAVAMEADPDTVEDFADPSARCAGDAFNQIDAAVGAAGVQLPVTGDQAGVTVPNEPASCVAPGERESDSRGSEITPGSHFLAEVECRAGEGAAGMGRSRAVEVGPVTVGDAFSTFRLDRAGGGLVTTVRSVVRDVNIAGVVHIDEVEAVATSWASGRSQPTLEGEGPTCDSTRTAGTCLVRTLRGVTAGDFHCSECTASNAQMAEAMQRALGSQWEVRLRDPEPTLAAGSANGALAAIQKPFDEMFADAVLNGDIRETLPALELVRVNDDSDGRVRQVYQFAGVQLASVFRIQCLLEIIDGQCTQQPGALSIELLDLEGIPLSGGVFELYRDLDDDEAEDGSDPDPAPSVTPSPSESESASPSESESASPSESESASPSESESASPSPTPSPSDDVDAGGDVTEDDGSLVDPLVDELVGDGVCTTGADGLGDCRFENLPPGDYIVRQAGAPDGFLAAPDFVVTVGPGQDLTATVTNVSAVGQVDISLVDGDGAPLAGGEFALSRPDAEPTGTCTTDVEGTCSITVALPDGPAELVLSQTAAPEGLAPAPDTPFTLAPGETFTFTFTNVAPAGGSIRIGLVDDLTDAPLAGGGFEVHADDGDGVVGDGDTLVATCTTGADGACLYDPPAVDAAALGREGPLAASGGELTVPLGAYVVRQTAAPAGYEPAEDLAFAFDAVGQVADITVRNGGGAGTAGQGSVGRSESFSPPPTVTGPTPMDVDVPAPNVAPTNAGMGGPTVQQVLQAPADLARLVVRDPLQALAFLAAWALFGAAATAIHRRTVLSAVIGA